jgi:Brp/Blh family beta-carotene 15,15'-monooxygenase
VAHAVTLSVKTGIAGLFVAGCFLWLDKTLPQAGVWALLLLSVSVGFVHGALDAVLLPQRFDSRVQAALMFVAYLLLVLLLGWALSAAVGLALWALLLMSAWHFGEPYGRWDGLPDWQGGLTRAVVGGAPVMLPVWLAPAKLAAILKSVVPEAGLQGWHVMAWGWLGLLVVWLLLCGVQRMRDLKYAWFELLGCVLLYMLFSPLMAFALYFGVYHAPVHVWRVWRCMPNVSPGLAIAAVALTTVVTWLLGAALWWFLAPGAMAATDWSAALRWLIVAFAALTAPHLVLISLCAGFLTKPATSR